MNIKKELSRFSEEWKNFMDSLSKEQLTDKEVMTLIVQYSQFVANQLNAKVLTSAASLWPEQLKNFEKQLEAKAKSQKPNLQVKKQAGVV